MPTPPQLRLQGLEDRNLLSAVIELPDDQVVIGTDANDVITLNRVDRDRVEVTVESFRDSEWTQPTDDPVKRYEFQLTPGELTGPPVEDTELVFRCLALTTNSIRVDAGGGTDRIEIIDRFTPFHYVSGTFKTDDPPADGPTLWPPMADGLRDEAGGTWVCDPEVAACVILPSYERTLTEGVDMAAGATVAVRFNGLPWMDEPIWVEPSPFGPDGTGAVVMDDAVAELPVDAAGLDLLIGWDEMAFPAIGVDGEVVEDGQPEPGDLSDLWVQWADDQSIDQWGADAGYCEDGSDGWGGENMDDWLTTDLET